MTSEWSKSYEDGLGRVYRVVYSAASGTPTRVRSYNNKDQLEKDEDPDGVRTLYRYNGLGEMEITAVDVDRDGFVDGYDSGHAAGKDRVTKVTVAVLPMGAAGNSRGMDIRRTVREVWTTDNSTATAKISTTDASVNGLSTWQAVYRDQSTAPETRVNVQIPTAANSWTRTVTQTAPDNSKKVTVSRFGRVTSVTTKNSTDGQVTSTAYKYNVHGLVEASTDARNGATSVTYNEADQVSTSLSPDPGTGRQQTTTFYDKLGRSIGTKYPDQAWVTNLYSLAGQVKLTYGFRTYAAGYSYDAQGRLKTMTNWSVFNNSLGSGDGPRVTSWIYDSYRGWLANKYYPRPDNGNPSTTGPSYAHTSGGRLKSRAWARKGTDNNAIVTTYIYGFDDTATENEHGDLVGIQYTANDPAQTPPVTLGYDRRGRLLSAVGAGTTTSLSYNDADILTGESHTGLPGGALSVTTSHDQYLRRASLVSGGYSVGYGYDLAGRLQTVSHDNATSTYTYVANSMLVGQVASVKSGVTVTTSKPYDVLNRMQSISTTSGGTTLSYTYGFDGANRRQRLTLADNSYWMYEYDDFGQVTSGRKYWSDGTYVTGQQFTYSYDTIGNRAKVATGGDATGENLRYSSYYPNFLNEYDSRSVARYVQSLGTATTSASVWLWSINGLRTQASRKGTYYWGELNLNDNNALYVAVTNIGLATSGGTDYASAVARTNYLPPATENFGHDLDGNLTNDSRWSYLWDAENRLVRMEARTAVGPQLRVGFGYDWRGRRVTKAVTNMANGAVLANLRYLYEGWNLVAELNATNHNVVRSYVWGLDLSGTPQGAGGVGGLLKLTYNGPQTTNAFVAYDGNGNVTGLIDAANGTIAAQYEYGPFGEVIRATGPMAKVNPIRFSTQYTDDETDLVCYLHRYYNPSTGRWLSRDPLAEASSGGVRKGQAPKPRARGGSSFVNVYAFVLNEPVSKSDFLGLDINQPPSTVTSPVNSCPCKCGPSVDSYVAATLVNISQAFLAAPLAQQKKACDNLEYKNYVSAIDAFDMTGVQSGVPSVVQSKFCEPCNNRLTFRGGCYAPEDVNYMMYGHITSLCEQELGRSWSASSVQSHVEDVKNARGYPIGCSVAFALAGYDGRPVSCSSGDWRGLCEPQQKRHTGNRTSWVWEPIQSRR